MSKRVYIRDYKKHGNQYCYVLDNICSEDLPNNATDKEKIKFVMNDYKQRGCVAGMYSMHGLADWLRDEYPNTNFLRNPDDIISLGKSWGYCQTKAKQRKFVQEYWKYLAIRISQIYNYFYKW